MRRSRRHGCGETLHDSRASASPASDTPDQLKRKDCQHRSHADPYVLNCKVPPATGGERGHRSATRHEPARSCHHQRPTASSKFNRQPPHTRKRGRGPRGTCISCCSTTVTWSQRGKSREAHMENWAVMVAAPIAHQRAFDLRNDTRVTRQQQTGRFPWQALVSEVQHPCRVAGQFRSAT